MHLAAVEIEWIRERLERSEYLYTLHADEERRNDSLEIADVETALEKGEILEEYPEDPRGQSCLVYGDCSSGPIHVVCGSNRSGWLVIVTVYRPAPPRWRSPRERSR